jgi:hypothetical protein
MTFLTDLKSREPAGKIFEYLSQAQISQLIHMVTEAVFKSENVMAEILIDDE